MRFHSASHEQSLKLFRKLPDSNTLYRDFVKLEYDLKTHCIFLSAASFFDTLFAAKIKRRQRQALFRSSEKLTAQTKC